MLELETLRGAVTTKGAGWDTLVVLAETDDRLPGEWLSQLAERAREQAASLTASSATWRLPPAASDAAGGLIHPFGVVCTTT